MTKDQQRRLVQAAGDALWTLGEFTIEDIETAGGDHRSYDRLKAVLDEVADSTFVRIYTLKDDK